MHGAQNHAVQFYDQEEHLAAAVASFLGGALRANAPAVVIATLDRRTAFLERLEAQGLPAGAALGSGQLVMLDARETLEKFVVDGMPVERLFQAHVGEVVERSRQTFTRGQLHAYGEMVDLLWREGRPEAALQLEGLWDRLAARQPLSLLCGYALGGFPRVADAEAFDQVCRAHHQVHPCEPFGRPDHDGERRRQIARLQQRERALAHEAAGRHRAELALHHARSRLQAQARQLGDALRAKDEMLALLGHELRNPLAPIRSALELLRLRGEERAEHQIIERQLGSLHRLIDDLFAAGRLLDEAPLPRESPSPAASTGRAAARRRVLVVDDNEDAARLLAELLGALGQEARVAHRASEALAVARQFAPEVALLDIGLPEVDGFELGRQLRSYDRGLRLIAVTGYGDPHNRRLSTEAGFEAHLVKPVQAGDVLKLL